MHQRVNNLVFGVCGLAFVAFLGYVFIKIGWDIVTGG